MINDEVIDIQNKACCDTEVDIISVNRYRRGMKCRSKFNTAKRVCSLSTKVHTYSPKSFSFKIAGKLNDSNNRRASTAGDSLRICDMIKMSVGQQYIIRFDLILLRSCDRVAG
ncbi:hypothetical protein D3C75_1026740 [compost metagenome]